MSNNKKLIIGLSSVFLISLIITQIVFISSLNSLKRGRDFQYNNYRMSRDYNYGEQNRHNRRGDMQRKYSPSQIPNAKGHYTPYNIPNADGKYHIVPLMK